MMNPSSYSHGTRMVQCGGSGIADQNHQDPPTLYQDRTMLTFSGGPLGRIRMKKSDPRP